SARAVGFSPSKSIGHAWRREPRRSRLPARTGRPAACRSGRTTPFPQARSRRTRRSPRASLALDDGTRKIGSRYGSRTDSADTVLVEGHTCTKEGKGRGPPPSCLGVWGREERTQPFRKNGRPVRLFTPTLRFLGISSIGLPLFGFRLLKK